MSKRLITSFAVFAFGMLLYWLGGGNFERGFGLAFNVGWSAICAMSVYFLLGGGYE